LGRTLIGQTRIFLSPHDFFYSRALKNAFCNVQKVIPEWRDKQLDKDATYAVYE
jgi:hypothetical protein